MKDLTQIYKSALPTKFKPEEMRTRGAQADAIIEFAAHTRNWPLLEQAVDTKLDDQEEFVRWWAETVRRDGRPSETSAEPGTFLTMPAAEDLTKIRNQQVSRWRKRLQDRPAYRAALYEHTYRKAMNLSNDDEAINAENLGNLSDAEIIRESIRRNASHGQQLSPADKQRMAAYLWTALSDLDNGARTADIMALLAASERAVQVWTKETRKTEKEAQQAKAWDLWLECQSERDIAEQVLGDREKRPTIQSWLDEKRKSAEFIQPPESRQHFDIWQFQTADKDAGSLARRRSPPRMVPPRTCQNLTSHPTLKPPGC